MKDVVKTANPQPKQGRPRRRRRNLSLYYLMLFVICVVIFLILSRTILFNIDEYIVSGNNIYTDEQILNAGELIDGRNMYGINLERTAERIKDKLIYVEDVTLRRKLPNSFIVDVTEAKAYACCKYNGSRYAIITRSGRYLEIEQSGIRSELILIEGLDLTNVMLGGNIESEDDTKKTIILSLLEAIDEICPQKITYIDITDRTNIMMIYDGRIEVDFGSSLDYAYKLRYIATLIKDNLDPEAEGTVIYHSSSAGASFIRKEDTEPAEPEGEGPSDDQDNLPESGDDDEVEN